MTSINQERLRLDVVSGAKTIYQGDLVEAGEGNVSVRVPNREEILVTPTFNKYHDLRKEDIVRMKFDGTVLSGKRGPSSEYRLHVAVYQARPRANAVIHTHSPYATMMSAARRIIPILIEEQVIFLGGSVRVSPFTPAHTDAIGENALKTMGTANGVLMANHGVLVCGRSMDHAVKMAELVEKLAWIHYGASQLGGTNEISGSACSRFLEVFEEDFATHSKDFAECI